MYYIFKDSYINTVKSPQVIYYVNMQLTVSISQAVSVSTVRMMVCDGRHT